MTAIRNIGKVIASTLIRLAMPCLLIASLQAAEWKTEIVDPRGGGRFGSLLLDKAGNAHASYVNDELHQLKYAFWDRLLGKWFVMTVDNSCAGFSSMTLDSKQHPHIAYEEYGTQRLKYAHWDGFAWKLETIRLSARLIEYYTSIALDPNDRPIITYYEVIGAESPAFLLHLRSAEWTGEFWQNSTIDWTSGSGKFNSVSRNAEGHTGVAYANVKYENSSLRYAHWNGKSWDIDVLEGAEGPHPVYSVSMLLDKEDIPHITYTDVAKHQLKYATRQDGKWELQVVDRLIKEGFPDRNGIALDNDGNPYISYYDAGMGALKMAHCEGAKWKPEVVDRDFAGFTSSIQIRDRQIFITYFDSMENSFKCARRTLTAAELSAQQKSASISK